MKIKDFDTLRIEPVGNGVIVRIDPPHQAMVVSDQSARVFTQPEDLFDFLTEQLLGEKQ